MKKEIMGNTGKVYLEGRVDITNSADLKNVLSDLKASGVKRVIIDMSKLEYIDSSGLGRIFYFFADFKKDGGEIGAGHYVTAFYEIEKTPQAQTPPVVLKGTVFTQDEALELRIRYKNLNEDFSRYLSKKLINSNNTTVSEDMGFASAVVEYAMLLRRSAYKENSSYDNVIARATQYLGLDTWGLREEFIDIVKKTKELDQ